MTMPAVLIDLRPQRLSITAKHGIIIDTSVDAPDGAPSKMLQVALQSLVGEKYQDTAALRQFAAGANWQSKQLATELELHLRQAL